MSLSKLSKLPPEVLSSVLNNEAIPLRRRLRLRLLCNLWADIIEDALKKETSLVVRDEKGSYPKPKPDDLVIRSTDLTAEFTRPLSRLFTSLTQLSFNYGEEASWSKLSSLLAHLNTTKLTTVKLYGSCVDTEQIEPLAAALTALSGLTVLTLRGYYLNSRLLPHLKPVLSRLKAFGYVDYSHDSAGILSSSLSPRCTHLWLKSVVFQSFRSPFLVELSRNLTHLHLASFNPTIWQSLSQMHGLSSLTLNFQYSTDLDSSFFSHLVPFTRLTDVKLYHLSYRAPLALPSKKFPPLSTIKRLTLRMNFGDSPVDYRAFFQALSLWFPSLVKLTIVTWSDTIPAIWASLGKLSFSVEIIDFNLVDILTEDW